MVPSISYLKALKAFKLKREVCNYPPLKVYIEPTNYCNLKCKFCANPIMERKKGYMDFELFKKILDESLGFVKQVYLFHSGDPLLHPKIGEMVSELNKRNIKSVIFTNAHFLSKEKAKNSRK